MGNEKAKLTQIYYQANLLVQARENAGEHPSADYRQEVPRTFKKWVERAEGDGITRLQRAVTLARAKAERRKLYSGLAYVGNVMFDARGYQKANSGKTPRRRSSSIPDSPILTDTSTRNKGIEKRETPERQAQAQIAWQNAVIAANKEASSQEMADTIAELAVLGYDSAGRLVLATERKGLLARLTSTLGDKICGFLGLPDGSLAFQLSA